MGSGSVESSNVESGDVKSGSVESSSVESISVESSNVESGNIEWFKARVDTTNAKFVTRLENYMLFDVTML